MDGTGGIMKIPKIYKEVDNRKCSLTDGDALCEHLLVLGVFQSGERETCLSLLTYIIVFLYALCVSAVNLASFLS
jgi:hypothetical protein